MYFVSSRSTRLCRQRLISLYNNPCIYAFLRQYNFRISYRLADWVVVGNGVNQLNHLLLCTVFAANYAVVKIKGRRSHFCTNTATIYDPFPTHSWTISRKYGNRFKFFLNNSRSDNCQRQYWMYIRKEKFEINETMLYTTSIINSALDM